MIRLVKSIISLKYPLVKSLIVFISIHFMVNTIQGQSNMDKEAGQRIKEASAQLSGKQYESALKTLLGILEDSHKYDMSIGRVASLYLNQLATLYPQAEKSVRLYVQKKIEEALKGILRVEHMDTLGKISELFKLDALLTSSFDSVLSAQKDGLKKKAWAKTTFRAMFEAKRYNDILPHIDLAKEAEMYLNEVKKKIQKEGSDRNMFLMSKDLIIEDFNRYLTVYRSVDDRKNVDKMNSLIAQVKKLGE